MIKRWIRGIVLRWLGLETVNDSIVALRQENNSRKSETMSTLRTIREVRTIALDASTSAAAAQKDADAIYRSLKSTVNLGLDVAASKHNHSFMVVCLKNYRGQDYVQFYNLDHYRPNDVASILQNYFAVTNKVQDYPMGMSRFDINKFI